ncbi:hypothetical protein [Geomicrobium sp. JCM 19039]|uniref:hypothetical protein n=1 Tax=Geomicrobium sp. JCM 19039 TaxID=1460636 RepID=UPI00045F34A1|nr:hypothetical protein [Geomicrobium sp. JCM 19039]GAK14269.1 UDP-N-acetylmuramoylalanyl-D-glutamyl-2,6-diaminopimelate-D-alanyl-D-alanine ligase [Geomicrobium sp. JCM 19039]
MESLLILLLAIAWALYTIIRVKRNVHMLQLNSYRNERYFRWMKGNTKKAFRLWDLLPFLSLIALPLSENISFYVIAAWAIIVFASLTALRPQTEEKKKLVYTSRVKRLLTTIGLVYLLIFLGAFWWSAGGTFAMVYSLQSLRLQHFLRTLSSWSQTSLRCRLSYKLTNITSTMPSGSYVTCRA